VAGRSEVQHEATESQVGRDSGRRRRRRGTERPRHQRRCRRPVEYGDIGTQLILGRLKALDKKVVGIQDKLKDTHDGVLFLKGYLKVHHQSGARCTQVETV
jgi:hypothetical protein